MWFDDLDKKIREAAERHQPSYNEDAWTKMEQKLNRHLPQKENSKMRYLLWLFMFLITGSALVLFISQNNQTGNVLVSKTPAGNQKVYTNEAQQADQYSTMKEPFPTAGSTYEISKSRVNGKQHLNNQKGATALLSKRATSDQDDNLIDAEPYDPSYITHQLYNMRSSSMNEWLRLQSPAVPTITKWEAPGNLQQTFLPASRWNHSYISKPPDIASRNKNLLRSVKNNVSLILYAGPSISSVSLDNPGKFTPAYGAALRYTINHKFSISTGLFINDKIYPAAKEDYHPPAGYWTNYTDLLKINADCKVFEIPVNISYSIYKQQKHEWHVTAGVSNYLMKRETYNYKYRNNAGQIIYRGWTLDNGGKYNLAVINLSAGYKYHLNKSIALSIDPMLKLPLKGVGFGNIKIYEAGTMVGLHIKPFGKK